MRAARSPDRTQTTAGAISHRRPDRTIPNAMNHSAPRASDPPSGQSGAMAPRHLGWKALAEAVAPGARVTRLRRLAGAGMTDAHDVTLDRTPRRVVVKLYRDSDGTAPLEWSRLEFAQRV